MAYAYWSGDGAVRHGDEAKGAQNMPVTRAEKEARAVSDVNRLTTGTINVEGLKQRAAARLKRQGTSRQLDVADNEVMIEPILLPSSRKLFDS